MRLICHLSYTHNATRVTHIVPHADTLAVLQPAFDVAMRQARRVGTDIAYEFRPVGWVETPQAWERTHVRLRRA